MKWFVQALLKSLLVALVYVFAIVLGGIIVSSVGMKLPAIKDAIAKLAWSFLGGVIAGLSLGLIASTIPAAKTRHFIVWTSVIFLNLASVAVEGYFFAPEMIGNRLAGLLVQQFLASLGSGWIITELFAPNGQAPRVVAPKRPAVSWAWRLLAGALVYVIFYFIFGATNYILVTKPYYETHAGGLTVPPVSVTLTAEVIRGALITLSILPFILTTPADKNRLALQAGFILFAIGGLLPLTVQAGTLPLTLLAASAVEIAFQNILTGAFISRLLRFDFKKGYQPVPSEV